MVNLTKSTGRHESYRPTLTKANYVPRHALQYGPSVRFVIGGRTFVTQDL